MAVNGKVSKTRIGLPSSLALPTDELPLANPIEAPSLPPAKLTIVACPLAATHLEDRPDAVDDDLLGLPLRIAAALLRGALLTTDLTAVFADVPQNAARDRTLEYILGFYGEETTVRELRKVSCVNCE